MQLISEEICRTRNHYTLTPDSSFLCLLMKSGKLPCYFSDQQDQVPVLGPKLSRIF